MAYVVNIYQMSGIWANIAKGEQICVHTTDLGKYQQMWTDKLRTKF
jgi:hypothetical protein